jgi:hypothetical protein
MSEIIDLRTSKLSEDGEPESNVIDLLDVSPAILSRRLRENLALIQGNIVFVRSGVVPPSPVGAA